MSNKLITDHYLGQITHDDVRKPHAKKPWGSTGARNFGQEVLSYINNRPRFKSVLDFGAGHGSLGRAIMEKKDKRVRDFEWFDYDPGVPGIDKLPSRRFDCIVSSDVLEHVEPEMIDRTLSWIFDHANNAIYMHIACGTAFKTLPDGRDAHLIQEGLDWWLNKFDKAASGWSPVYYHDAHKLKTGRLRQHLHILYEYSGGRPKPDKMKYYSDDPARGGLEEKPQPYVARYVSQLPLDQINGRLIRNPNYGGDKAGIHGWCTHAKVSMGTKPMFREALGDSLREEGFRNPVVLYATSTGNWLSFGGSRVDVGRKVGLRTIPCIVNDYCGRFKEYPEVTEENFNSFFTDIPKWHVIDELGVDYHYAIERKRRSEYDAAGHAWCTGEEPFLAAEFPWIGEGLTREPNGR